MGFADFIIRIGLNSSNFTAGKNKTVSDIQQIDVALHKLMNFDAASALAGTGIGALLFKGFQKANAEVDKLIEKADRLKTAHARTGIDTMRLQQGENLANANSASPDTLVTSTEKVADAMQSIRDGADDGAKLQLSFARLAVTLDDIKRKNHQQVFFQIFENLKNMEMTTERIAALKDIFGKNAGELIPMAREGMDSKVANRGVLSDSDIEELDQLKRLNAEANATWGPFLKEIAMGVGKSWSGLKAFPSIIAGYVSGPEDTSGDANLKSNAKKMAEIQTRKAEAEARKAAEKKKKDDLEKKAKEIATRMAQEQERAQREEVQSARPSARRGILANRNRAIAARLENIDTQIRINGDPDGSLALERQRLLNDRSENRRGITEADRSIKGVSLLQEGVSDRQRVGLFTGRADNSHIHLSRLVDAQQTQITELRTVVNELRGLRGDINE